MTHASPHRAGRIARATKRVIDLAAASVGLAAFSPVLAAIAVAAVVAHGRPILFRQQRAGLGGRSFTMVKFRTMRSPRADEMTFQADAQRITRLGRVLRASSLDELPELWNVLKGEMSLVGPRPLLMEYLDRYTPEEARRHDVRPGMTGWAAVNGRHTLPFEERLRLDSWYVDNWSLLLDLRILASTVGLVLRRKGVATIQRADELRVPERFWVEPSEETIAGSTRPHPARHQA